LTLDHPERDLPEPTHLEGLGSEPPADRHAARQWAIELDAETAGRRFERADHVGEAGGSRLGERWARPCEDERESD